jgi:hypothetical protein
MYFLNDKNNIIKISSKKTFINNFKELYFKPDLNIKYNDKSYLNYIYEEKINNIKYTFNGFFKDNYFCIIYNSYDENLDTIIYNKEIIIMNLEWVLKKTGEDISLWVINNESKSIESNIMMIRNKLMNNSNINIEDSFKIFDTKTIYLDISFQDIKRDIKKEYDFKNIFKLYFGCKNDLLLDN